MKRVNNLNFNISNNIVLSTILVELVLMIVVLFKAKTYLPMPNKTLFWLFVLSLTLIASIIYFLYTNKEFYNIHKKKFHVILLIVLILLPTLFTGYIRSYASTMPIADDWAQNVISNNIKQQIYTNVKSQYPNLPQDLINNEVEKQYAEFLKTNSADLEKEVQSLAKEFRSKFQADNNQTYFIEADSYYYYHQSVALYRNGYAGDELIIDENGNEQVLMRRIMAPNGIISPDPILHTWLETKLYSANNLAKDSDPGDFIKSVFFLPVIFSMLTIIPLFLIIRQYSSNIYAFMASLSFSIIGTFLSRTQAGFVDTDAYNVFFPMVILALIIYGVSTKHKWLSLSLGILAGLTQIIYLWAWGNSWYLYLILLVALISYTLYCLLALVMDKKKFKEIIKHLDTELIVFGSFILSSQIFSLLYGQNIIKITINSLFGYAKSGLTMGKAGNIWPNVFSSVAELNPASFNDIISSVGGGLIFFIALFGILFLVLDFNEKKEKYSLYKNILLGASVVWFSLFLIAFKNMGFLETIHNSLLGLTVNNEFTFLFLLLLPILIGALFSLHNTNADKKIFLAILLTIWVGLTIFMSLNAIRFILLLATGFSIAFGIGLFYIGKLLTKYVVQIFELEKFSLSKYIGVFLILIIFLFSFIPSLTQAHYMGMNSVPSFDDDWFDLMNKVKDNSTKDAIITSWWDFGHFFIAIGERGATFDGATQQTPISHWVGKLLLENDEHVAKDILKMLNCGGNNAFDEMMDITNDSTGGVLINKVIYSTLGKENKKEILKENKYFEFSDVEIERILKQLDCEETHEQFFVASEDMVGKAGVWAHWGLWDFSKKYTLDNYNNLSPDKIAANIDEPVEKIELWVSELQEIDLRANLQNIQKSDLINYWLAPYPTYVQLSQNTYWVGCENKNNTVNCQNIINVNLKNGAVNLLREDLDVNNFVFMHNNTLSSQKVSVNGTFDFVLRENGGKFEFMVTQHPLGESTFTKTFYLEGLDTDFELFDSRITAVGWNINTYKVKWD
jgi:dolichyl-phosphooligosaccharide-protein glycotransferase